jgi:hypothetical protein
MASETRFGEKRNAGLSSSSALRLLPRVQPANAGTTWSDDATAVVAVDGDTTVVVVDGGTGPVNDNTNVAYA